MIYIIFKTNWFDIKPRKKASSEIFNNSNDKEKNLIELKNK